MTDFVFLVSPQKIAMLGLIALGFVVAIISLFLATEVVMRAIGWYFDRINDYHEAQDDRINH